jgi:hypothetical protein
MACNAICALLNDDICMNLCVLALDPCLYYIESSGGWCYVLHSSLASPIAKVALTDHAKIAQIDTYIKQNMKKEGT